MVFQNNQFEVTRMAPKRTISQLPFPVWMELAKAMPRRTSELVGNQMGFTPVDSTILSSDKPHTRDRPTPLHCWFTFFSIPDRQFRMPSSEKSGGLLKTRTRRTPGQHEPQ